MLCASVQGVLAAWDDGFRCELRPLPDAVVVVPVGELDVATVPMLEARFEWLRQAGHARFVVDLRRVSFLEVRTLGLLLRWTHGPDHDGIDISVIGGPQVRRLADACGVGDGLVFVDPSAAAA